MYTRQILIRKILFAFSLTLFIVSMATTISIASDDNNRYRDNSQSGFTPGWMNAANYQANAQANAIIAQQTQPKRLWQNIVEFMQGKTENKIEQSVADKPKPVLQQKQSSTKTPGAARKAVIVPGSTILQIMNDAINNGSSVVKLDNGNIVNVWKDASDNACYFGIKDSSGKTIVEKQLITQQAEGGTLTFNSMYDLGNGNFMIRTDNCIYGVDPSNPGSYIDYTYVNIFDSSGALQGQKVGMFGTSPETLYYTNYQIMDVTSLGNGKIAFLEYGTPDGDFLRIADTGFNTISSEQLDWSNNDIKGITSLGDGRFATVTLMNDGNYTIAVRAQSDTDPSLIDTKKETTIALDQDDGTRQWLSNFTELGDGKLLICTDIQQDGNALGMGVKILGNDLEELDSFNMLDTNDGTVIHGYYINQTKRLDDGSVVVAYSAGSYDNSNSVQDGGLLMRKVSITDTNQISIEDKTFTSSFDLDYSFGSGRQLYLTEIVDIGGGQYGILTNEWGTNSSIQNWSQNSMQLSDNNAAEVLGPGTTADHLQPGAISLNANSPDFAYDSWKNNDEGLTSKLGPEIVSSIFKSLLAGEGNLSPKGLGLPDQAVPTGLLNDALKAPSLLNGPNGQSYKETEEMQLAMKLSDAIKNPSEDQKAILDAIKALLGDTDKVEKESGKNVNPELVKAQNDLLNAVANILLAQGVPDLLKKGDMANIKGIFSELDTQKNKIILEYARSTKPYYDNMLKDLSKNMAILQLKNILSGNMSKDQLEKLPPSELDKILAKIKADENKIAEERDVLKNEAEYRTKYLDPNKQKLEADMKNMLKDFTGKINGVLKASDKK